MKVLKVKFKLKGDRKDVLELSDKMKEIEENDDLPLYRWVNLLLKKLELHNHELDYSWWKDRYIDETGLSFSLYVMYGPFEPAMNAIANISKLELIEVR